MLRNFFANRPDLKSPREISMMREAGKLVSSALKICRGMVKPGITTIDIDKTVEDFYKENNALPLFKGYPGKVPFPAVTCISVNEQVVHGIPGGKVLREGDILKIDTACKLNGWCADAAISVPVGLISDEKKRLIDVGEQVLQIAIKELSRCKWWSEVAFKMQKTAEDAGFSVVTQYVGHGIGKLMHEFPQVPNYVNREVKKQDFKLEEGLVLAVEPMINMGRAETEVLRDHWTVVTRDGLPSVHVEHTLALTKEGVYVLTAEEELIIKI
jgi:methionyl aminopeptidase